MINASFSKGQQHLKVAIHQPNFLPRLKVLQKLAYADVWCVLDSVQYCTREWQNRARIVEVRSPHHSFWHSIPVHRPNGRNTLISEIVIAVPSLTAELLRKTLLHAFRRAPYWKEIDELFQEFRQSLGIDQLWRLCVASTCSLLQIAGKRPKLLYASALPVSGKASNLLASICRHLGATTYLADSGSRNYLNPTPFGELEIKWQNWREPPEKWVGVNSWRDLSSVNYLAREGPEKFKHHLLGGDFMLDSNWEARQTIPIRNRS